MEFAFILILCCYQLFFLHGLGAGVVLFALLAACRIPHRRAAVAALIFGLVAPLIIGTCVHSGPNPFLPVPYIPTPVIPVIPDDYFPVWFENHRPSCDQCSQGPLQPLCEEAFRRLQEWCRKRGSQ